MKRLSLSLLIALLFVLPASANAATHSGRIILPQAEAPASLNGELPPQREADREVLARYNASTGTILLEVEVWNAPQWGVRLPRQWFGIGSNVDHIEELTGHVEARDESGAGGNVELQGYEGALIGTGSYTGQRFAFTFTSPTFIGRDWHCVAIEGGGSFALGNWPKPKHNHRRAR
jgi:hypothetical protein